MASTNNPEIVVGRTIENQDHGQNLKSLENEYEAICNALRSYEHVFFSPETSPHPKLLSQSTVPANEERGLPTIASLQLHPALESALHIMNCDLPSAHFLLRHAQAPPAWECMYLHGILHRIEGDIDNARAWYTHVQESDVLQSTWAVLAGAEGEQICSDWCEMLDKMQRWRDRTRKRSAKSTVLQHGDDIDWATEEADLRRLSLREIEHVLSFCAGKFGLVAVEDTRQVWVDEERHLKEKKQNMIVGGEGWREF